MEKRALAAGIVANGNVTGALMLLRAGQHWYLWGDWPARSAAPKPDQARAEKLDPQLLAAVKDRTRDTPAKVSVGEARARVEAIVVAAQTSTQAFANSARDNQDVTLKDLLSRPHDYRGKVIHVEGRLKRLRRLEPTALIKKQGIKSVYEGLVYGAGEASRPVQVVVSALPASVRVGDDLNYPVAFDGYFFQKYLDQKAREFYLMPVLIGRTFKVTKAPAAAARADRKKGEEKAPPVGRFLVGVKDQRRMATSQTNVEEFWGLCQTIAVASRTSAQAFANSARENPGVTFAHMHNDPAGYRGKVIHLQGRLGRLRRLDLPPYLETLGVTHLYEGWVFGKTFGSNPSCILFTDLPANVRVGENVNYLITFDGYFFKKYRYTAVHDDRYAPLLIGRTIARMKPGSAAKATTFSDAFVVVFISIVGGTILVVVFLTWLFSRGDRHLRKRLDSTIPAPVFENAGPDVAANPPPASQESANPAGNGNTGPVSDGTAPRVDQGFRKNGH